MAAVQKVQNVSRGRVKSRLLYRSEVQLCLSDERLSTTARARSRQPICQVLSSEPLFDLQENAWSLIRGPSATPVSTIIENEEVVAVSVFHKLQKLYASFRLEVPPALCLGFAQWYNRSGTPARMYLSA